VNLPMKSKIMIVDDDPDIILVLEQFLSHEGFTVISVSSGKKAIETMKENPVDLFLIDIAMPILSGADTLRELKKIDPNIQAIMITGYRDAEKVVECFRLGAYDCIFKPFDFDYLRTAIMAKLME
jgi:DNA-binding NtrC family response regulator